MFIDEIAYVLIDYGVNPSIAGGIKLKSFFNFVASDTGFDFFTGEGTVDLIGCGLFDGFGDEGTFGERDEGEGVVEKMVWLIIHLRGSLHLSNNYEGQDTSNFYVSCTP